MRRLGRSGPLLRGGACHDRRRCLRTAGHLLALSYSVANSPSHGGRTAAAGRRRPSCPPLSFLLGRSRVSAAHAVLNLSQPDAHVLAGSKLALGNLGLRAQMCTDLAGRALKTSARATSDAVVNVTREWCTMTAPCPLKHPLKNGSSRTPLQNTKFMHACVWHAGLAIGVPQLDAWPPLPRWVRSGSQLASQELKAWPIIFSSVPWELLSHSSSGGF